MSFKDYLNEKNSYSENENFDDYELSFLLKDGSLYLNSNIRKPLKIADVSFNEDGTPNVKMVNSQLPANEYVKIISEYEMDATGGDMDDVPSNLYVEYNLSKDSEVDSYGDEYATAVVDDIKVWLDGKLDITDYLNNKDINNIVQSIEDIHNDNRGKYLGTHRTR